MQSTESPVNLSGAPNCVKLAFDKAWFHTGPAEAFNPACGAWHGRQTCPVPSRLERSCGEPVIPAQAGAEISAAENAIAIVVFLIRVPARSRIGWTGKVFRP